MKNLTGKHNFYINYLAQFFLVCAFCVGCTVKGKAQNIALNKPYTLSVLPNYNLTAPSTDKTSLTDGSYTSGKLWTNKTTVGWTRRNDVTITIDLQRQAPVRAVNFNSVRGSEAGVNFPANIYVFISSDNQNYAYLGDAAQTDDNASGTYKVEKFSVDNLNATGRYVKLVVVPNGKFIFCDEIEIIRGNGVAKAIAKNIPVAKIKDVVDSLTQATSDKKDLARKGYSITTMANKSIAQVKGEIGVANANKLKKSFATSFVIEKYNPWDTLSAIRKPVAANGPLLYDFAISVGGVQYGAFVITNTNTTSQTVSFNINNNPSIASIDLFEGRQVPSLDGSQVVDPLVPIMRNANVQPGESKMFVFKVTGKASATAASSTIGITSQGFNSSISVNTNIINISGAADNDINTVNWAYLNYPMLKNIKAAAVKDLKDHHINTFVIPAKVIPKPGDFNFTALNAYIQNIKPAKNILLFANYSAAANQSSDPNVKFMTDAWKANFIKWYAAMIATIKNNGGITNIYLYPYDEARKNDITAFNVFAKWAKQSVSNLKLFGTLTNADAIKQVSPYLSVSEVKNDASLLAAIAASQSDVWIYDTKGVSRSLSPYQYYRLMAWNAFAKGLKGIGFWNYADIGSDRSTNLISAPFKNVGNDFAVIYNSPDNGIITSRRWEAFKLGIEDYRIISTYSKKFGVQKTKDLVLSVTSAPSSLNKADEVRNRMIKELVN
ncbi:discoidin domain-containing protein [Mucilaginibacter rigui]|uniref:Discoidin domain-containing protein n=1 Tax=Mucilaginibacter rigui TaxID=534635 RepID=A0ABR7X9D2_9SPHI|nr:discoidin domain-containing protein [Mucilaginibacter rigui]MBD1386235.1 discoidin domain-containing protein [Mucilaginibacter rigui]